MPDDDKQADAIEPDSSPCAASSCAIAPWSYPPHSCSHHLQDPRWQILLDAALEADFWKMISGIPPEENEPESLDFGLIWTDAKTIQTLNHDFRGIAQPTNVLSFVDGERDAETGKTYLGDVFLCWEIMAAEASDGAIPMRDHTLHLMLHGVLHLFGYDHIDAEDAEIMESLESELLSHIGLSNPYAMETHS